MKKNLFLSLIATSMLTSSCYVSHFTVGDGPVKNKGAQTTYDKGKNVWLFWGLININDASPNKPVHGNYQLKTKKKLGDVIITGLTAGIVTTETVKIKVKKVD